MISHFSFSFEKITDPHLTHFKTSSPRFFSLLKIVLLCITESKICHSFLYLVSSFLSFFFNCSLTFCPNRERYDSLSSIWLLSTPYTLSRSFFRPAPSALSVACAFDVTSSFFNGLRVTCANRTKHCSSKNRRQRFFPRRSHVLRKSMPSRCFSCGIALAPSPRRTSSLS